MARDSTIQEADLHRMLALIFGAIHAQAVTALAELGIADTLRDGQMSLDELAGATDTSAAALERVLRMLVQLDVLSEPDAGLYRLTSMGQLLQSDHPHSLRNYARLTNCDTVVSVAARMLQGLQTGDSQFTALFGTDFYESLPQRPEEAAKFAGAMQDIAQQDILAVNASFDFSDCDVIVDVGGGQGHLLAGLLESYPALGCILFDLPTVVENPHPSLLPHIRAGRCEVVAGNFLESVPPDGDIYLLKRVLSHCTDADATTLLRNIRRVMKPDSRVVLADPDPESLYGASFDVLMLVLLGGGLRSETQLQALFNESGLGTYRAIPASEALGFTVAVTADR